MQRKPLSGCCRSHRHCLAGSWPEASKAAQFYLYYNPALSPKPRGHQGEMMFSHVMLGSNDIERSKRFYDAVLGVLGAGEPILNKATSGHNRLFYQHGGSSFGISEPINGEVATCANGGTIGFQCNSAQQVQQFHDTALAHGGQSCEDPPGLREGSMGAMHLAYVRDPDGNKLCAICRL
jgi:catechol 2,3-dioxygenase-like lactoylglutathione lyase family enzyme